MTVGTCCLQVLKAILVTMNATTFDHECCNIASCKCPAKSTDAFNHQPWLSSLKPGEDCTLRVALCPGLLEMAVTITPLQFAVEMAVANTVVAAAAALPPICRAAAYA